MRNETNPRQGVRWPGSVEPSHFHTRNQALARSVGVAGIILGTLLMLGFAAPAGTIYQTNFDEFTAGPDQWAGCNGWEGNNLGIGVHGIDQDVIPNGGLLKTAFIGSNQPGGTLVSVSKPFNIDPGPGDLPIVEVETIVGIQDSVSKPNRDSFLVSILNADGEFLAAVHFANQPSSYGIWREDGLALHDTGALFFRGELHLLYLRIDPRANLWSADLDGIPLFTNAPLTATSLPVNFGAIAYEWLITAASPAAHGDNWMLVADTIVRNLGDDSRPPLFCSVACDATGATLTWQTDNGFDYQVEHSNDLVTWFNDLPDSSFPGITTTQSLVFRDPPATGPRRYYRLIRTHTP